MTDTQKPLSWIGAIDKPVGISSYDVIRELKHVLPPKTKIGHGGTLDPLASGILVIGIGKATKQLSTFLLGTDKEYVTTVELGAWSESDDAEGPIHIVDAAQKPSLDEVEFALQHFVGTIQQRPPAYSAVKIGGKPAYEHARDGKKVEIAEKTITIDAIKLISYKYPYIEFSVACKSGVYIRSLARDLGEKLGTRGYVTALRRTRVGEYTEDKALTLEKAKNFFKS
jgi:tRNA pseudouridine55 synthase